MPPAVLQTYNFTVPSVASPGVRCMRVMQQESGSTPLDPCASFNWGSVTDFSVNIMPVSYTHLTLPTILLV